MIDLPAVKKIYFIGIKGVAMAGLAIICKQRGMDVRGSDIAEEFITDAALRQHAIEPAAGFSAANLDWEPDLVVVGASWGPDHVEVNAAHERKLTACTDSDLRGVLSREKSTVAVTGVHGKTTTTAWLAHVLRQAKIDPSYLVGTGAVPDLDGSAHWGAGEWFVVEGDEYVRFPGDRTAKFLDLNPSITIITSLEWEHVDVYPNVESLEVAFSQLVKNTQRVVVACGDWPAVKRVVQNATLQVELYGLGEGNTWRAVNLRHGADNTEFTLTQNGSVEGEFRIKMAGEHNVCNAVGVLLAAQAVGVSLEDAAEALSTFRGSQRRFEVNVQNGVTFIDDYGHHPTEVKKTLEAVRLRYPDKKIWCVFQPHMASRTAALLDEFAVAFNAADAVFICDIFASARETAIGVTSKELAAAVAKYHADVHYAGALDQVIEDLRLKMVGSLVLVTMGAGDVYKVRDALMV